ncbi:MAG: biopolymer transporter ExbD, partial [Planctomycetota bacterium]|nr:biopolymer transporter ExbD [Planctomycetota bacterium]
MNASEFSGPHPAPRPKGKPGTPMANPPLTPLIDVFLFLIIFFLLGCRFMQLEGTIPANLPNTGGVNGVAPRGVSLDPIRISLTPSAAIQTSHSGGWSSVVTDIITATG